MLCVPRSNPAKQSRGPLAPGEHSNPLIDLNALEEQGSRQVQNFLVLLARCGLIVEVVEYAPILRQARVDVLGIGANSCRVSPFHLPRKRRE